MLKAMKPTSLASFASLIFAGILLAAASVQLCAAPAPYYKWTSRYDSQTVCSQTPLGPGWVQGEGPYSDSRCMKRVGSK
jgi:hypothetical protein